MILLISGFIAILVVSFGAVMLAAGPTQHDKRIVQRLALIQREPRDSRSRTGGYEFPAADFLRPLRVDRRII